MDEDVKQLLKSWDLGEYEHIFAENKISLDTLALLDTELVKELIRPVGDRAIFMKKLAEFKDINDCLQEERGSTSSVDILNERHKLSRIQDITNIIEPGESTSNKEILSAGSPAVQDNVHTNIYIEPIHFKQDNKHLKIKRI